MKSAIRKQVTKLGIEELENRCVPAGNVLAVAGPVEWSSFPALSITGDDEANEIRVVFEGYGQVRIEGLNGTTVNGLPAFRIDQELPIGNVHVDMGSGDDAVTMAWEGVADPSIQIDGGLGNDAVAILYSAGLRPQGLRIDTGNGDDHVTIAGPSESLFVGPVIVNTGNGNDRVDFRGRLHANSILSVDLGRGDDVVAGEGGSLGFEHHTPVFWGGEGYDRVLGVAYFDSVNRDPLFFDFEEETL